MFHHARRLRVLAALGLILAAAQGRAWGEEPICAEAAELMSRIRELLPFSTRQRHPAEEQHSRLFAWEKQDDAEAAFALGRVCEISEDYDWAYLRYQALARRYPSRSVFAAAADRANGYRLKEAQAATIQFGPLCDLHSRRWRPSDLWFAAVDGGAFAMPERKDMLPDSERSHVMEQLGLISDPTRLPAPADAQPFMMAPGFFH
jgi:hypothetical protein